MNKILILDFGSQYTQLIARRVREAGVYCEIHPFNKVPDLQGVKGVILSGSPASVNDEDAPQPILDGIRGEMPVLGICYGAQWLAKNGGGSVGSPSVIPSSLEGASVSHIASREYGRAELRIAADDPLFHGMKPRSVVWMSHGDSILTMPYQVIATTEDIPCAAFRIPGEPTWGIQFHPEVHHSEQGAILLRNFAVDICGCAPDWTPANFVDTTVASLRETIGDGEVILGLSGGVDSSVAARLLHKAIGPRLHCIFVDSGLLRKGEFAQVLASFEGMGLDVRGVDASERFFADLKGVTDPEAKRKIIGRDYVQVFEKEARNIPGARFLAQGTIYPDVIESAPVKGPSATIKSHHNVGGLPERMSLKVIEPLRLLFKDEVRRVGAAIGLDPAILGRHPFPGPGLGIRVLGEVTREKVSVLQEADDIFIRALRTHGLYDKIWQAGAMLLPVRSVGVMGDERTYEQCVALRAVTSVDGMTADWYPLPYNVLAEVSSDIINRVRGVNRVVYDVSSKPPATIEWE